MKLGLAKQICKLQGINFNIKVPVICPFCECKQALIDSNTGKWMILLDYLGTLKRNLVSTNEIKG
ncbi:hypothetical protein [Orenia marismortui]|uniref:hypothetical protein n=1 Tax=Orenia marismortui TaxID=46469 RepID=UPI00036C8DA9|nr:hypothetical protein [Orenia marismortui]